MFSWLELWVHSLIRKLKILQAIQCNTPPPPNKTWIILEKIPGYIGLSLESHLRIRTVAIRVLWVRQRGRLTLPSIPFEPLVSEPSWRRKWLPTPVFLPGKIPWTKEPGGLQSMEVQRVGHD